MIKIPNETSFDREGITKVIEQAKRRAKDVKIYSDYKAYR